MPSHSAGQSLAYFEKWKNIIQERSPELQVKRELREQKKMAQWSAGGSWLPRLDWQLSSNRTNANLFTGAIGSTTEYRQSVLALSFPIYRRSTDLNLRLASTEFDMAQDDYEGALFEIDWKLRQWVGQWLIAEYKSAALLKSLEAAKRTAHETRIRFERGSRSQLDVLRTQAQMTSLESQSLSAKNEARIALDNLLQATGLTLADLEEAQFPWKSATEAQLETLLSQLTNVSNQKMERQEVVQRFLEKGRVKKNIERTFVSSQLKAKLVFAKEWPELTLKASHQRLAGDWDELGTSPESRNVGLTLTIPLFNFGSGYSGYRESSALESVARIQSDQNLRAGLLKVEQLFDQIQVLKKISQAQELRRNQSIELERLTAKSYELGKSTVQDLLSAQNETLNAKVDVAKSRLELVIAERQLEWNFVF